MNVTTITDQTCIGYLMAALGISGAVKPKTPGCVADGIMRLNDTTWTVITNDNERYTLHLLEDATEDQAWNFHRNLCPKGWGPKDPRVHIVGSDPVAQANN